MSHSAHLRANPAKKIWKSDNSDYLCGTKEEIEDIAKSNCLIRVGLRSDFSLKEINEISKRFTDVVIVADTSILPTVIGIGFLIWLILSIVL